MAAKVEYITGKRQIESPSWCWKKHQLKAVRVWDYQHTLGEKDGQFEKGKSTQMGLVNYQTGFTTLRWNVYLSQKFGAEFVLGYIENSAKEYLGNC